MARPYLSLPHGEKHMIRVDRKPLPPTGGRSPAVEALSRQKAQSLAEAVARRGLSPEAWRTLDQLYYGGIMTIEQIELARRTLRNYAKARLITRHGYSPKDVARELGERFLVVGDGQLYTLGPVGMELMTIRHGVRPTLYYLAYPFERILTALILNEIIRRIEAEARQHDWKVVRYSFEQAQLHREERVIFSPSALISLEQDDQQCFFALEYHDEKHGRNAWRKVKHYEDANESGLWEEKWLGESFPAVLAVFRLSSVGEGYQEATSEMAPVNTSFYGRSLEGFWQAGGMDRWVNIAKGNRGNVFPWLE
jgi:hypothetical protein